MDRFKFRGRGVFSLLDCEKRWFIGFIKISPSEQYTIDYWDEKHGWLNADVDLKTVGQSTGLKDKNGELIFEGDIICIGTLSMVRAVFWKNGGFGFYGHGRNFVGFADHKYLGELLCDIQVIGNIHDNQELLKGGE